MPTMTTEQIRASPLYSEKLNLQQFGAWLLSQADSPIWQATVTKPIHCNHVKQLLFNQPEEVNNSLSTNL